MKDKQSGFTLIELLVVIAIISILSVIVFVALNPIKRFSDSRDARRLTDIENISKAIRLYQVDNNGAYPDGIDTTYRMLGTSSSNCDVDCQWEGEDIDLDSSCLDLSNDLVKHIKVIPSDPQTGSPERTHYAVALNSEDILDTIACDLAKEATTAASTPASGCTTYSSSDVPISISSSGTPTITSSIDISNGVTITDVNVLNLTGDHTWIHDLNFNLQSPAGTQVRIMDNSCGSQDDFNINFDDESANAAGSWPCPPTDGDTYQPSNSLSSFDGEDSAGTWNLIVNDTANADGGSLQSWSIEICY